MPDWIKSDDEAFDEQMDAFHTWINVPANAGLAGFSSTEVNRFNNNYTNWKTTYARTGRRLPCMRRSLRASWQRWPRVWPMTGASAGAKPGEAAWPTSWNTYRVMNRGCQSSRLS